jgi:myo-inositol 2-dehydrogenase/D-chiro-inositol 1-dehydrogenase
MGSDHAAILAEGVANARLTAVQDFSRERAIAVGEVSGARVFAGADELIADPDVDATKAQAIADRVGARRHETGEALIADANVEAVVIASWGRTHATYVLAALAAQNPVLSEIPLATSAEVGQ